MSTQIRANTVLPAHREPITLTTADGLRLIGEISLPENGMPKATSSVRRDPSSVIAAVSGVAGFMP